jgi:hypothetical protein
MSTRPDPGLFRWFWANGVTKPCPDCRHPTSVGFDRADPGVAAREPTRCVLCTAAQVDNAVQFSRGELGHPLTEQGPCVSCGDPTRRYGPHASSTCGASLDLGQAARQPNQNHQPAGQPQTCPPDLEVQPEPDLELSA